MEKYGRSCSAEAILFLCGRLLKFVEDQTSWQVTVCWEYFGSQLSVLVFRTVCASIPKKPKNMRAAVVEEFKKLLKIWTDWKDPEIGPDQAIIKIMANGICRSDWHLWQGHRE